MRGLLVIAGLLALPGSALAQQTDYSAGKTPAQLFSGDCSACHQSPRGLAKGKDQSSLANFLREHYTTKAETAGSIAAYLLGNPGPAQEPRNNAGRTPRGTPASAPPAAAAAPPPKPADDDPLRRIFRSPSAEPETSEGAIAAPEPGEESGKQKGKPRTAGRPPADQAGRPPKDAAKDKEQAKEQAKDKEKEAPKEAARPRKPDPADAAKAEAAKAEEAAREAAAREAAAKAEAAKAEAAAKVRSYVTGGEPAAPPPERPTSTPPG